MTTQQNDTAALTDEQLDAASGGPHYTDWVGFRSIDTRLGRNVLADLEHGPGLHDYHVMVKRRSHQISVSWPLGG